MEFTVQNVCGLLIKSKLLSAEDVKTLYDRWLKESGSAAADLAAFTRWLVAQHYVTEYQAGLVAKGHTDSFFLHQYKILDRLGRGRMAGVYKALHNLGQIVAIKVLPPSRGQNPHILARFQREMKLAQQLKHPNVVRTFQVGEANGVHYLVMEYLDGETLKETLKRRKTLPAQEALRLVHQALAGLQHIYDQGLVHRDLKPTNLMLVPAASKEGDSTLGSTLKILDLGLGRELHEDSRRGPDNPHLTTLGVVLGTPDYLAPEQARDPRGVDIRADIYSLGCVLFHTLTGQPPFPDTNMLSLMARHATEPPRQLKELNPAAPDGLQAIVNCMMAKEPSQRYATPEKAAQALRAFLSAGAEPVNLQEEGPQLQRFLTWLESDTGPVQIKPVSKKHKKHKSKKHHKHHRGMPVAPPLAIPLTHPGQPGQIDVELVPTPRPPAAGKRRWLLLLMLGVFLMLIGGLIGAYLGSIVKGL